MRRERTSQGFRLKIIDFVYFTLLAVKFILLSLCVIEYHWTQINLYNKSLSSSIIWYQSIKKGYQNYNYNIDNQAHLKHHKSLTPPHERPIRLLINLQILSHRRLQSRQNLHHQVILQQLTPSQLSPHQHSIIRVESSCHLGQKGFVLDMGHLSQWEFQALTTQFVWLSYGRVVSVFSWQQKFL